jgi:hypothetical protein
MPPRRPLPHSNRPNLIGRQAGTVLCLSETCREEVMKKLNGTMHCARSFRAVRHSVFVALVA